jgi:hypothetical protein
VFTELLQDELEMQLMAKAGLEFPSEAGMNAGLVTFVTMLASSAVKLFLAFEIPESTSKSESMSGEETRSSHRR